MPDIESPPLSAPFTFNLSAFLYFICVSHTRLTFILSALSFLRPIYVILSILFSILERTNDSISFGLPRIPCETAQRCGSPVSVPFTVFSGSSF